jgi:aspartate/methionine/tyrosine aminotransferase
MDFSSQHINFDALRKKAFNGRWATIPSDVIPLTAADPDFPIAPEIKEGIVEYLSDGYLCYGPFSGLFEFKTSVATHFNLRKKGDFLPEHVLAINSAAQGMYLVAKYLLSRGDEAIILDPVDFLFKKSVEACGAQIKLCKVNVETGAIDLEHLEHLITPQTKLISICNPHNPLGKVYNEETLLAISNIAEKHHLWIMSDEIWSDILYDHKSFCTFSSVSEYAAQNSFIVYGFSKTFGLAGLRIGAILCKNSVVLEDFIEKSNFNSTIEGVSTLSQIAASVALEKAWYWTEGFIQHLDKNRKLAIEIINNSSLLQTSCPEATFVIFPKIICDISSEVFVKTALEKGKVAIVPGSERWFGPGAQGHVRICFSTLSQKVCKLKSQGFVFIIGAFCQK